MKRIAIISDTHGLLRDEVKEELEASDIVIHAGDINTDSIVQELKGYGELYIVRGNNDKDWAEYLPKLLAVTIEGVQFLIVHNKKDIPENLTDIDVVIYGHSHKYDEKVRDGILLLNPGSCGKRRFDLEISMCRMYIDQDSYTYEKIILPQKQTR
ncbi:metallophosphoesterase family protein [Anaerovorax sp. IOR16]|uniref:metallophosphoesterase family protein n=1 Tax=Anaerovorax sp. IOR16 TaxID=2773458 RepID=UPI0019D086CC|nr:metallophosphoesterase family protein [Anaerovorax sp. IOR16]